MVKCVSKSLHISHPQASLQMKLLLISLFLLIITTAAIVSATVPPSTVDETTIFKNSASRASPSSFPVHFTRKAESLQNNTSSSNSKRANFEDTITRTAGTNCNQPSSSLTCDMCCNGNCCENPSFWTPKSSSLDNTQIWIPIRFAFVIPSSFTTSTLPSQQAQKDLLSRTNKAFEYFPFRFLWKNETVIQDDSVWQHCATDPCFTNSNCGFVTTLLPAVNADVHNEIVLIMCHGINYLGEAQFPWAAPAVQYLQMQLDKGMTTPTIVHELGHYLGLMHTFEGGCTLDDQGDWVSDTVQSSSSNSNCNIEKDSCPGIGGVDDTFNFMNYALNWNCGLSFTTGQRQRAIAAVEYNRPTLVANTRVSLTTSNSLNASANSVERTPACATTASSFSDCWCENEVLDPSTYCRAVASDGATFAVGPTPAPQQGGAGVGPIGGVGSYLMLLVVGVLCVFFL